MTTYRLKPRNLGPEVIVDETTRTEVTIEIRGMVDSKAVHLTPSECDQVADALQKTADAKRRWLAEIEAHRRERS